MSNLPQRKKSAAELAQLRESLGINTPSPSESSAVDTLPENLIPEPEPPLPPDPVPSDSDSTATHLPKPVRSLRKSEQGSIPKHQASKKSGKIPQRRHTEKEVQEIRRREAFAMLNPPPPNPKLIPAHPAFIAPGYLLAVASAGCFVFEDYPLAATSACAGLALICAALILIKRPLSRHHAAFIAIIAVFVIIFGALHYFPHLKHGT